MQISSKHDFGDVSIVLSGAGLVSGWDIAQVRVAGHELPPTRKGEFETEEEAKQAALARAEQFRKDNHIYSAR